MAEMTRRDGAPYPAAGAPTPDRGPADADATVVLPAVGDPRQPAADGGLGAGRDVHLTGAQRTDGLGDDAHDGLGGHPRDGLGDDARDGLGGDARDGLGGDSLLAGFDEAPRRRRWPRVLLTVVGVLVVLAGGYVGAAWALGDRVPRGTTVAGVELGGLDADAAVSALRDGLAGRATEAVPVTANDRTASVDPAAAGLRLDVEGTVDRLTGFDLQPRRLWQHAVGGGAEGPVTDADPEALSAALEGVAGTLAVEPVDAGVVFADGAAHTTEAVEGSLVDANAAAAALRDGWLTADRPLELPTRAAAPDITQDEAERALTTVAEPFAAAPVVVVVGDQSVELPVEVLTSVASFVAKDSDLTLTLDGPRLVEEVLSRTTSLLTPASDARFEFSGGVPVIVPGTPGTTLDPTRLVDAVSVAATGPDRTARVDLVVSDPARTTQALEALGVKEVVSEFSTPLTNEPDRTENLRVAASKITGDLVLPGETFSLTEALGPVTAAAGFNEATVIVNGEHVPGIGGGLSQMATTSYNAAFFAGFEDVAHQPHSEWFARYPEGRESTLYTGVIDMAFKNTSPYGALLQSWVADGRLHVRIWGTKHFTVETTTSPRSDVVRPTTVRSSSPTCTPQSAGNPGFTVTVTRRVLLGGVEQESTSNTWRYKPQNAVVCDPAS